MTSPRQTTAIEEGDDFAAARRRWPQRRKRLLDAEGGVMSAEHVAHILKTTLGAVEKGRQEGILLGLPDGREGYVYPKWQFDNGNSIVNSRCMA